MASHILPVESSIQAPLQTELVTLNQLVDNDILDLSARLLDSTNKSKSEAHWTDCLLEKCEDVETICDHVEFILKQSKQILLSQPYTTQEVEEPMEVDEGDMEELVQIQKDRLDRLRNVILLGMDADKAANNHLDNKEDLLF
ncbi:hypothetical protein G6F37_010120 [Rhizopus arrhizus]|nr:hypothetical protein G6F38_006612 [Rhizopus arrhizus]KAG1153700.1 hypothetical protein G6F37_010120 [Rhizopus arrhizus]